jgi:hypothetical protein
MPRQPLAAVLTPVHNTQTTVKANVDQGDVPNNARYFCFQCCVLTAEADVFRKSNVARKLRLMKETGKHSKCCSSLNTGTL